MTAKKIGVLGCGMIAERGHLPALVQTPGLVVDALYDLNFHRSLELQRRFGVAHAYPTEDEFWRSDLDAVVICSPAPLHLTHVLKAAEFGKHVLCEKPLAETEADIRVMIAAMTSARRMFFTGFCYRFSPSALEIHRLVREKAVGEVRSLRLTYLWNLHGKWTFDTNNRMIPSPLRVGRMLEGGPMVDCGVHQIDLARWWLGSEVQWQRGIGVWVEDFAAPDHVYLHMGHESGAHTMVEMSFSYNATAKEPRTHFQYELIGTDGVIRFNREEHTFEVRNSHGTRYLPWHPEKNFAGLHREFAHALFTGEPRNMPTAEDGLAVTRIARAATEEAIRDRELSSRTHPSSVCRSPLNAGDLDLRIELDHEELDDLPDEIVDTKAGPMPASNEQ
jgi:predicted dehydrogenase